MLASRHIRWSGLESANPLAPPTEISASVASRISRAAITYDPTHAFSRDVIHLASCSGGILDFGGSVHCLKPCTVDRGNSGPQCRIRSVAHGGRTWLKLKPKTT